MRKHPSPRKVRRAYSQSALTRICTLREDRFGRAFGMQTVRNLRPVSKWTSRYSDGPAEDYYHFKDNNSNVLAVAHLDTVVRQQGRVPAFHDTVKGPLIVSGALDDRLGAYVILDLLPKLGVVCDWLLTVGEESGMSTAEYFDPKGKQYDHVIEFDRGGTDVVMYQYEDDESMDRVEAAGARVGFGSFSDIAFLEHLGVKAFNWGVGYDGNYHSVHGYAYLDDTFAMVAKYLRFHAQNAGVTMPHDPERQRSRDGDEYYECRLCGRMAVDSVTWYCESCGACADCFEPEERCQCYLPASQRKDSDDGKRALTWEEYTAQRPDGEPAPKALTSSEASSDEPAGSDAKAYVRAIADKASVPREPWETDDGREARDALIMAAQAADAESSDQSEVLPGDDGWAGYRVAYEAGRKRTSGLYSEDLYQAVTAARRVDWLDGKADGSTLVRQDGNGYPYIPGWSSDDNADEAEGENELRPLPLEGA